MGDPGALKWRVLARDRESNDVRQVYAAPGGGYTRNPATDGRKALLNRAQSLAAIDWAGSNDAAGWATTSPYPFLVLDSDTRMVRPSFARKLNDIGADLRRYMWIGEGWRTYARQAELYRQYLNGTLGAIAARPGTSNHESGWAADISVLHSGRGGSYTNLRNYPGGPKAAADHGCFDAVPSEAWHYEPRVRQ